MDDGIETDETVKVLVVLVASMAKVTLLVMDSVEMVKSTLASMVTLSDPLVETLEIVPPDPVNSKILLVSFNTALFVLSNVPAPERTSVYPPILNAAPLYVSVLVEAISMVLPEAMESVPEWVIDSFTSNVPPFNVVVPAKVPVSDKIRLLEEGIETLDRVKILPAAIAAVAELLIERDEMV